MSTKPPVRLGSVIGLKEEYEERYVALHRHVFPEVLERIRRSHITDYAIFLADHTLFSHMVYAGADYAADMAAMAADAATRDWWRLTDPMQEPLAGRRPGEWWQGIDLRFHAEWPGERRERRRHAWRVALAGETPDYGALERFGPPAAGGVLSLFEGNGHLHVYLEVEASADVPQQVAEAARALGLSARPREMREVFHTGAPSPARTVFVSGCFDLLHSGHVAFFREAAAFGDLHVGLGSDATIRDLKGRYTVNPQDERKYMIGSLACVRECTINRGSGLLDFEPDLRDLKPDLFVVNDDGHTPAKEALCRELGIGYRVLKRVPHGDLPGRSTTALRRTSTIPFRIDLAGGWLDQPFVSRHHPGAVVTISIEPTVEFNHRSGMASSTRNKAIELWGAAIPHGDPPGLAKVLFSFENPPGTAEVAGSQDALGIVCPGLNRLDYDGGYWPSRITGVQDEAVLSWIERHLYLVTLGPRAGEYSVIGNRRVTRKGAQALADAADDCWRALLAMDLEAFGRAFQRSFEAQVAMFPNMADEGIRAVIDTYREKALGWKLSGAGGGGYLILVSGEPVANAMQIRIRRRDGA